MVMAHNTQSTAIIWSMNMPGNVHAIRILDDVVIVPVSGNSTRVLDLATGELIREYGNQVKGGVVAVLVFSGL